MTRLLIVGRNNELARDVFSRTASHAVLGSSLPTTREAVFYSGITPESAAGGTRQHSAEPHTTEQASGRFQPTSRLDACFWWDCIVMFLCGWLTIAVLTLVLL